MYFLYVNYYFIIANYASPSAHAHEHYEIVVIFSDSMIHNNFPNWLEALILSMQNPDNFSKKSRS